MINKKCLVCGDEDSCKTYIWQKDDDYKGKVLCNKHYTQLNRKGYLTDETPSKHEKRKIWTNEEKIELENLYKQGLKIEDISKTMERTLGSINSMVGELGLGIKFMRSNNVNFKAIYQDYNWCYEKYVIMGMSHQEMANEAGANLRVIQKKI